VRCPVVLEEEFRIEGIRCHAVLGVNAHERVEKQAVVVGLVFCGEGLGVWGSKVVESYQAVTRAVAEVCGFFFLLLLLLFPYTSFFEMYADFVLDCSKLRRLRSRLLRLWLRLSLALLLLTLEMSLLQLRLRSPVLLLLSGGLVSRLLARRSSLILTMCRGSN
jgi:hypothetical protein